MANVTAVDERADGDVLRRLQIGDESAMEHLIECYGARVLRVALGITRSRADAEEIAQDVFLAVARRYQTFKHQSRLATWIHRITVNAALNKRRGLRHVREISQTAFSSATRDDDDSPDYIAQAAVDPTAPPDDEALSRQRLRALADTIGEMPAPYRGVLLLQIEGLSPAAMARALKLSLAAVKSRLHRARLALHRHIAQDVRLAGLVEALG